MDLKGFKMIFTNINNNNTDNIIKETKRDKKRQKDL